jgi:hypothetical protein
LQSGIIGQSILNCCTKIGKCGDGKRKPHPNSFETRVGLVQLAPVVYAVLCCHVYYNPDEAEGKLAFTKDGGIESSTLTCIYKYTYNTCKTKGRR